MNPKQYTPIRRFYAIIGFIVIVNALATLIINIINKLYV